MDGKRRVQAIGHTSHNTHVFTYALTIHSHVVSHNLFTIHSQCIHNSFTLQFTHMYLVTIHSQFMYICSHNSLTIHSHVFIYASAFTIRYVKVCILAFPMVSASIAGWDLWLGIVGLGSLAWDLWHWISCLDSFP